MTEEKKITVQEIFAKVQKGIEAKPEKVKEIGAVFLFKITGPQGGVYHLDLMDSPGVTFDEKDAQCTFEVRDRDFIKLYKGVLPGYKAALSGKLKISGNLLLATRLSEVFESLRSD